MDRGIPMQAPEHEEVGLRQHVPLDIDDNDDDDNDDAVVKDMRVRQSDLKKMASAGYTILGPIDLSSEGLKVLFGHLQRNSYDLLICHNVVSCCPGFYSMGLKRRQNVVARGRDIMNVLGEFSTFIHVLRYLMEGLCMIQIRGIDYITGNDSRLVLDMYDPGVRLFEKHELYRPLVRDHLGSKSRRQWITSIQQLIKKARTSTEAALTALNIDGKEFLAMFDKLIQKHNELISTLRL